jgi:hypothetical protein
MYVYIYIYINESVLSSPLVSMKSTQMRYQLLQTLCFSLTDVGLLFLFSPQAPPGAQTALRESTPRRPVCVWACVRKRVRVSICVRVCDSFYFAFPLGFRDQGSSACKHSTCIHTNNIYCTLRIAPYAKRTPSNLPKNVVNFCKPTLCEAHTHSRTTVSSVHYAHVHENDLLSASVVARQAPQSASTVRPANTLLLWAPLHPPPAPAPCVQLVSMAHLGLLPLQLRPARHVAPGNTRRALVCPPVCVCGRACVREFE